MAALALYLMITAILDQSTTFVLSNHTRLLLSLGMALLCLLTCTRIPPPFFSLSTEPHIREHVSISESIIPLSVRCQASGHGTHVAFPHPSASNAMKMLGDDTGCVQLDQPTASLLAL